MDRYEVVITGDSQAALFAGLVLKQRGVRYAYISTENLDEESIHVLERVSVRQAVQAEADLMLKSEVAGLYETYVEKAAKVSGAGSAPLEEAQENALLCMLLKMRQEEEAGRIFKPEFAAEDIRTKGVLLSGADCSFAADQVIYLFANYSKALSDKAIVLAAGQGAAAIVENRRKIITSYMDRLRIRHGSRSHKKSVYITHSRSWFYMREMLTNYAVKEGTAPLDPFMNYGFYLNGTAAREEIMACCHQMIRNCDEVWVFGPISEAMLTDIMVALWEGKPIHFYSIGEQVSDLKEITVDDIIFEREVHAGQIRKSELLDFIKHAAPHTGEYYQMSLFGEEN